MNSSNKSNRLAGLSACARFLSAALFGIGIIFCAPFSAAAQPAPQKLPSIVVGIAPIKYLVYSIAGDHALVSVVLPNGGDPHTYEPSAIQMGIIGDADYYFSIRLPFEEILLSKLKSSAPNMTIVDISSEVQRLPPPDDLKIDTTPPPPPPTNATMLGGVGNLTGEAPVAAEEEPKEEVKAPEESEHGAATEDAEGGEAAEGEHGSSKEKAPPGPTQAEKARAELLAHERSQPDPHIWLSPANMRLMAKAVLTQLINAAPAYKEVYTANYNKFIANLDSLDASLHALLDPLPEDQRTFLSFHPSWAYFARDYKLTQIAVEMKGYEPSPLLFAHIIDEAKARHVRTILLEQQFSSSLVSTLTEELNANVVFLSSLTFDWSDNLHKLAQILAKPPEVPEGFYKDVDALNAQRNATTKASPE